jgi:two-component sensor histidine kinase
MREFKLQWLLLAAAASGILPVAIAGFAAIYFLSSAAHDRAVVGLKARAESVAAAIAREIGRLEQLGDSLSASRWIAANDLATFDALARDAAAKMDVTVALIDQSYQQLTNTLLPPDASLPKTRHTQAIDQALNSDRSFVSDLAPGTVSQTLDVIVWVPVAARGRAEYVLAIRGNEQNLLRVLQEQVLPAEWRAAVIDGDSTIVARTVDHDAFFGRKATAFQTVSAPSGYRETTDLQGHASLTAWAPVGQTKWRAVVWAPKAVVYADGRAILTWGGLILLVTLATALFLGLRISRHIEKPITLLASYADKLGAGKLTTFPTTPVSEVNAVGRALISASERVADRERALIDSVEHVNDLMRELSHRIKNLMAVVMAVARQTARSSKRLTDFTPTFEHRLAGLSQSIELLTGNEWRGASLRELIGKQLTAFAALSSVKLSGPDVKLPPEAVQHLGMALHELATNALKHGALSHPGGHIEVSWIVGQTFELRWQESGGPLVVPPVAKGFGLVVIERMVAQALDGEASVAFRPGGLTWTLKAPAHRVVVVERQSSNDNVPDEGAVSGS